MPSAFDGYSPRERVKIKVQCRDCRGSGCVDAAETLEGDMIDYECPTCKGSGKVEIDS